MLRLIQGCCTYLEPVRINACSNRLMNAIWINAFYMRVRSFMNKFIPNGYLYRFHFKYRSASNPYFHLIKSLHPTIHICDNVINLGIGIIYCYIKGVIVLRIYVADREDTLFKISHKYQIGLLQMMSANPHIPNPDTIITGESINIPSREMQEAENRIFGEFCPPVPEPDFLRDWIPHISAEQMAEVEYDVLIVGTGAGEELPSGDWPNSGGTMVNG